MTTTATRIYEIDMGHCLPTHQGKCHAPHGHRYRVEATVVTEQSTSRPGASDDGMVADFTDIKTAMADVLDQFDHKFVICVADPRHMDVLHSFDHGDVIVVPYIPTAENLAAVWGDEIANSLSGVSDDVLHLSRIVVYETPNAWASWEPEPW